MATKKKNVKTYTKIKKNTKRKNSKKKKLINSSLVVRFAFGLAVVLLISAIVAIIYNNRSVLLKDMKTSYKSLSIDMEYSDDCSKKRTYKIDFSSHDTFGIQSDATKEEYNSKRYFLGSDDRVYQKFLGGNWTDMNVPSSFVMPDTRVTRVLENLRSSSGEELSSEDGLFVFGIKDVKNAESVYVDVNSLTAFGNNWDVKTFSSINAKVFLDRDGNAKKIIFYPIGKDSKNGWKSGDYICDCKQVTWLLYDYNKTIVNYKDELWNVIKK